MILFICLSLALKREQNIDVTDDNWQNYIGGPQPVLVMHYFPTCPISSLMWKNWNALAKLYPHVLFIKADCWYACPKYCKSLPPEKTITTPFFYIYPANSTDFISRSFSRGGDFNENMQYLIESIDINLDLEPMTAPIITLSGNGGVADEYLTQNEVTILAFYNSSDFASSSYLGLYSNTYMHFVRNQYEDKIHMIVVDVSIYNDEASRFGAKASDVFLVKKGEKANKIKIVKLIDITGLPEQRIFEYINMEAGLLNENEDKDIPNQIIVDKTIVDVKFNKPTEAVTKTITRESSRTVKDLKEMYNEMMALDNSPGWTGTFNERCEIGNLSDTAIENAVKRINYYRKLADIKDMIKNNPDLHQGCMKAAATLFEKGSVSHYISDFGCYGKEKDAYEAARYGEIGQGDVSIFNSIQGFILDSGDNNIKPGHRFNLLDPRLAAFGFGFHDWNVQANNKYAMTVIQTQNSEGLYPYRYPEDLKFIAWPPVGPVDFEDVNDRWSINAEIFGDKDIDIKDIWASIQRDDGETVFLAGKGVGKSIGEYYFSLHHYGKDAPQDTVTMVLDAEARRKVVPGHSYYVQLFVNGQLIRYKTELIDMKNYRSIDTDKAETLRIQSQCTGISDCVVPKENQDINSLLSSLPKEKKYSNIIINNLTNALTISLDSYRFSSDLSVNLESDKALVSFIIPPKSALSLSSMLEKPLFEVEVQVSAKNSTVGYLSTIKRPQRVIIKVLDKDDEKSDNFQSVVWNYAIGCPTFIVDAQGNTPEKVEYLEHSNYYGFFYDQSGLTFIRYKANEIYRVALAESVWNDVKFSIDKWEDIKTIRTDRRVIFVTTGFWEDGKEFNSDIAIPNEKHDYFFENQVTVYDLKIKYDDKLASQVGRIIIRPFMSKGFVQAVRSLNFYLQDYSEKFKIDLKLDRVLDCQFFKYDGSSKSNQDFIYIDNIIFNETFIDLQPIKKYFRRKVDTSALKQSSLNPNEYTVLKDNTIAIMPINDNGPLYIKSDSSLKNLTIIGSTRDSSLHEIIFTGFPSLKVNLDCTNSSFDTIKDLTINSNDMINEIKYMTISGVLSVNSEPNLIIDKVNIYQDFETSFSCKSIINNFYAKNSGKYTSSSIAITGGPTIKKTITIVDVKLESLKNPIVPLHFKGKDINLTLIGYKSALEVNFDVNYQPSADLLKTIYYNNQNEQLAGSPRSPIGGIISERTANIFMYKTSTNLAATKTISYTELTPKTFFIFLDVTENPPCLRNTPPQVTKPGEINPDTKECSVIYTPDTISSFFKSSDENTKFFLKVTEDVILNEPFVLPHLNTRLSDLSITSAKGKKITGKIVVPQNVVLHLSDKFDASELDIQLNDLGLPNRRLGSVTIAESAPKSISVSILQPSSSFNSDYLNYVHYNEVIYQSDSPVPSLSMKECLIPGVGKWTYSVNSQDAASGYVYNSKFEPVKIFRFGEEIENLATTKIKNFDEMKELLKNEIYSVIIIMINQDNFVINAKEMGGIINPKYIFYSVNGKPLNYRHSFGFDTVRSLQFLSYDSKAYKLSLQARKDQQVEIKNPAFVLDQYCIPADDNDWSIVSIQNLIAPESIKKLFKGGEYQGNKIIAEEVYLQLNPNLNEFGSSSSLTTVFIPEGRTELHLQNNIKGGKVEIKPETTLSETTSLTISGDIDSVYDINVKKLKLNLDVNPTISLTDPEELEIAGVNSVISLVNIQNSSSTKIVSQSPVTIDKINISSSSNVLGDRDITINFVDIQSETTLSGMKITNTFATSSNVEFNNVNMMSNIHAIFTQNNVSTHPPQLKLKNRGDNQEFSPIGIIFTPASAEEKQSQRKATKLLLEELKYYSIISGLTKSECENSVNVTSGALAKCVEEDGSYTLQISSYFEEPVEITSQEPKPTNESSPDQPKDITTPDNSKEGNEEKKKNAIIISCVVVGIVVVAAVGITIFFVIRKKRNAENLLSNNEESNGDEKEATIDMQI